MLVLEVSKSDIQSLSDSALRELVGRLCEAEVQSQSLPSSSVAWGGAQTAADGGLDVEVDLKIDFATPDFVPRRHTGFQVKKHSMSEAACFKEMHLNSKLRPVIKQLISEEGSYVIVSGKDDCTDPMHKKRIKGMKRAIKGQNCAENLHVDFYGVDRLTAWVRKHPIVAIWVRNEIGIPLLGWSGFERWAKTPIEIEVDEYFIDDQLSMLDATNSTAEPMSILEGLDSIRELLKHSRSSVRLTGLSGVGKTRFAQALFEPDVGTDALNTAEAIYVDLGFDIQPSSQEMLAQLIAKDDRAIMIVDNCPPDAHRRLQQMLRQKPNKVSLLTIEYDISDDKPEETNVFKMGPSSENIAADLVERRYPSLGQLNCSVVARFSGGNARIALALAATVDSEESLSGFSDGDLFMRLFKQRKGDDKNLAEQAQVLALVYSFDVNIDSAACELAAIGEIGNFSATDLYRAAAELESRQLVQRRSHWRAVLPHALANKLAKMALKRTPLSNILGILEKKSNQRLLASFSKRLSFLHDSADATSIAKTWLQREGYLSGLTTSRDFRVQILCNIAPLAQCDVLNFVEREIERDTTGRFASRDNENFSELVNLLYSIAYEEKHFNRATAIISAFAITEAENENLNSISERLKNLFALYLSGTHASPTTRANFIRNLFNQGNKREKEVALTMLSGALNASHWSSSQIHDFGARPRDYGYKPATSGCEWNWFKLFILVAEEIALSNDIVSVHKVRAILGRHFRGIWRYVGAQDELIRVSLLLASDSHWTEGLQAVSDTIEYDGEGMPQAMKRKLVGLQKQLSPKDIRSKIENLVFRNIHESMSHSKGDYETDYKEISREIRELGRTASSDPNLLEQLAGRLFAQSTDARSTFGEGMALSDVDKKELFMCLLDLLEDSSLDSPRLEVLCGFIKEVDRQNHSNANDLLDLTLCNPKTRKQFVYLQSHAKICEIGFSKLLILAEDANIDVYQFNVLASGRVHEQLDDGHLSKLLRALLNRDNSIGTVIHILTMRFHVSSDEVKVHSPELLALARLAVAATFTRSTDQLKNDVRDYDLQRVCALCLGSDAPRHEVENILNELLESLLAFRIHSINLKTTLRTITKDHTNELLAIAAKDHVKRHQAIKIVFSGSDSESSILGKDQTNTIIEWCSAEKLERFNMIAPYIFPFSDDESCLSAEAHLLIESTPDKKSIVEAFYQRCRPRHWSEPRSKVMAKRRLALEVLHSSPDNDVASTSIESAKKCLSEERYERERESKENLQMEQTFE